MPRRREDTQRHNPTKFFRKNEKEKLVKKRHVLLHQHQVTSAKVCLLNSRRKPLPKTISLATLWTLLFLEMARQVYSPWCCLVRLNIVRVLPVSVFLMLPPGLDAWTVSLLWSQTTRNGSVLDIWQWIIACSPMFLTIFVGSMFKSREKPEMLLSYYENIDIQVINIKNDKGKYSTKHKPNY